MKAKALPQQVIFDPRKYTKKVQSLIIAKAEQLGCPPSEAIVKLLNELAEENERLKPAA